MGGLNLRLRMAGQRPAIQGGFMAAAMVVAGGFDYLIKTRVADMAAYRVFLGDVLLSLPGVRETRTYAVMEEVKATASLPV